MRLNSFFYRFGLLVGAFFIFSQNLFAVIRDGGIDPANLGKGDWIYSMTDATNKLGGHIPSVNNETTLMQFYKSQGIRYMIVKAASSDQLFNGCYPTPQFTSALCNVAHANGILIFGYNRSWGSNITAEVSISDYVFNQGADGFVWDAEAEWETGASQPWITNGPVQAWQLCSTVRSNWPNKFLAHAPFPIIYRHATFPYKEFGYWCDTVMPQIYHFNPTFTPGLKKSQSGGVNWTDVNFAYWHNSLYTLPPTNINGLAINWTNSIKPLAPVHDVYGEARTGTTCQGGATAQPDKDVTEVMDYLLADPNSVTAGGYKGVNYWRNDLHGTNQWANIKAGTSGDFSNIVNHVVIDSPNAVAVGAWRFVQAFSNSVVATSSNIMTSASYVGETGTDTNTFGVDYLVKGQGTGSSYVQFTPKILVAGLYDIYQWHPERPDASATVPFVINYNGGSTTVFANQQTNSGDWSVVGRFAFAAGTNGNIRVMDSIPEAAAVVMADGLKLVYVQGSVPAAPSGLTATSVSASEIDLTWVDNSTNETSFIVARSTTSGGPYTDIATNNANTISYNNTGLSAATTYYYVVRAVNAQGASPNSNQASATTATGGPVITQQPQNQSVVVGQNATFSVTATGNAPLSYQWQFNTVNLPSATTNSYTRVNAQLGDAGSYTVIVSNTGGSVTSSVAVLTVVNPTPPAITSQPQSQTIIAGQTASFSVTATGTTLGYQWYFNSSPVASGTASTYSKPNAQLPDAGSYFVIVSNNPAKATSSVVTLTVNFSLAVSVSGNGIVNKSPDQTSYAPNSVVSLTASSGGGATFSGWSGDASGSSNPLSVVMTTNQNITANFLGTVSDIIIDNTNTTFSITLGTWLTGNSSLDKYGPDYRFCTAVSGAATSNATYTPNITTSGYYDVYIWYPQGPNRSTNTPWTVFYSGGSVTTNVNQQINGGDWRLVASEKKFNARGNGYVQVGNNTTDPGKVVMADAVKFSYAIIQTPVITIQPQSSSVKAGTNLTFTVTANGATSFNYQWQFNGTDIPGANSSAYSLNNVRSTNAGTYSVTVSDAVGSAISDPATLDVSPPVISFTSITRLPNGQIHLQLGGDQTGFVLEVTTNFSNWAFLTNSMVTNGTADYYDPINNAPGRFYRGRVSF